MSSIQDLDQAIDHWLKEDIREGDHTTFSTIPSGAIGSAILLAKQEGIIAGIEVTDRVFKRFDSGIELDSRMHDGNPVSVGDVVLQVSGKVHSILQCERLVLNIVQRMSGIATSTREYVQIIEGTGTRILDTRKTTPGFRLLEKEAVRIGGGINHRFGLYDMIMIKDNHIDFAGGIEQAIQGTLNYLKENNLDLAIEVETRTLQDVEKVLAMGGIQRIMFDNFSIGQTREAVKMIGSRFETESSGGITRETIRAYAECGVDFISVGALTHQVNSLDLSLKADFQ
ncbi:MAG: carboxylating nicotinate-nucleotide diphosphorylase [Bacteroidales bacterium]|nr:carboxylating nicotinate-nucleotide diphosphorylase [Bacteroidales bacterium]